MMISLIMAIFFLFLSNYTAWISLLSIKITVFDCCMSLFLIPYPLSASFHLRVNGEYWFHLYFCSLLCLSIVWPVSLVPSSVKMLSDSLLLAYSGIKHTIINLLFHPPTSSKPYLNLKPSHPGSEMNCPPPTVCSASSLPIFFPIKRGFYTDVIFSSSCSSRFLKNHRLQGHGRHKHLHHMAGNQLPLKKRSSNSLCIKEKLGKTAS